MSFQCIGHCLQNLDAGGPGAGTPIFKEPACDGFVGLLPDLTEILFQIVADSPLGDSYFPSTIWEGDSSTEPGMPTKQNTNGAKMTLTNIRPSAPTTSRNFATTGSFGIRNQRRAF